MRTKLPSKALKSSITVSRSFCLSAASCSSTVLASVSLSLLVSVLEATSERSFGDRQYSADDSVIRVFVRRRNAFSSTLRTRVLCSASAQYDQHREVLLAETGKSGLLLTLAGGIGTPVSHFWCRILKSW